MPLSVLKWLAIVTWLARELSSETSCLVWAQASVLRRDFIPIVPLSTQVYEWIPANLLLGHPCQGLASSPFSIGGWGVGGGGWGVGGGNTPTTTTTTTEQLLFTLINYKKEKIYIV